MVTTLLTTLWRTVRHPMHCMHLSHLPKCADGNWTYANHLKMLKNAQKQQNKFETRHSPQITRSTSMT